MTVQELREILKNYPDNLRVVVRGYEGGVNDVSFFRDLNIELDANANIWYYGRHEDHIFGMPEGVILEKALEICGENE